MRWRVVALISLGVNLALALAWLVSGRHAGRGSDGPGAGLAEAPAGPMRTNIVLRGRYFRWRDVESADYPTYIANLRDIGCPEQTIRDIIIADVNALYTYRRATNIVTAEQQWWRSEPDSNIVAAAGEKLRALDEERKALLGQLLGPNWESGDLVNLPRPSRPGILLDGPILGALAPDTKQALEEVNLRSQDRLQAYVDAQKRDGKEPDPVELAKLRQQTRGELERLLAPSQLEEYLLRYSQNANNLRSLFGELRFFNPTPDEFRQVFRATDLLDERIQLLGDATDPNSVQARKALEDQRENAIKTALGSRRYADYQALQDPVYRDAVASAEEAGTPDAAGTIYQIKLAALTEQDRIRGDTNLTAEQKSIELKRLELEQLQANTVATGRELPPDPPVLQPKRTYTLRPGDTVDVVAIIYGIPASAIRAANPKADFSRLKPGDAITIPRVTAQPVPPPPPN